jgi:hypothetical protein
LGFEQGSTTPTAWARRGEEEGRRPLGKRGGAAPNSGDSGDARDASSYSSGMVEIQRGRAAPASRRREGAALTAGEKGRGGIGRQGEEEVAAREGAAARPHSG